MNMKPSLSLGADPHITVVTLIVLDMSRRFALTVRRNVNTRHIRRDSYTRIVLNVEGERVDLKDSGEREQFDTGSQRDIRTGKGRYDLIPPGPLFRLARIYEDGAVKYDDNNWRKGQPLSRYEDSAKRHIEKWAAGIHDEDHLAQAAWNVFALMWTEAAIEAGILPKELADIPVEPPAYGDNFKPSQSKEGYSDYVPKGEDFLAVAEAEKKITSRWDWGSQHNELLGVKQIPKRHFAAADLQRDAELRHRED